VPIKLSTNSLQSIATSSTMAAPIEQTNSIAMTQDVDIGLPASVESRKPSLEGARTSKAHRQKTIYDYTNQGANVGSRLGFGLSILGLPMVVGDAINAHKKKKTGIDPEVSPRLSKVVICLAAPGLVVAVPFGVAGAVVGAFLGIGKAMEQKLVRLL
jgi:hypothetical protein